MSTPKLILFIIIGIVFYVIVLPMLGGAKNEALAIQAASELEQFVKDVKQYYGSRGRLVVISDMTWVRNFDNPNKILSTKQSTQYGPVIKEQFIPCLTISVKEKTITIQPQDKNAKKGKNAKNAKNAKNDTKNAKTNSNSKNAKNAKNAKGQPAEKPKTKIETYLEFKPIKNADPFCDMITTRPEVEKFMKSGVKL